MTHFQVFVAGRNVEDFVDRCMLSITSQEYEDFDVIVVDDASSDETPLLMYGWAADNKNVRVFRRERSFKMPANLTLVRSGNPEDVVLIVDADDFLPNNSVLSTLASYYEDPELWLTYGSYSRHPDTSWDPNPALEYPQEVRDSKKFRNHSANLYNHPLTFKRWLFNKVSDSELMDDYGEWLTAAYDHVIMMPMLELASAGHYKCLPENLYVYNEENPASENKVNPEEGHRSHRIVNGRTPRETI